MKDNKGRMICASHVGDTIVTAQVIKTVRHIFQSRIDHLQTPSAIVAYEDALEVFNRALENNLECLYQWDYLLTKEDVKKNSKNLDKSKEM